MFEDKWKIWRERRVKRGREEIGKLFPDKSKGIFEDCFE